MELEQKVLFIREWQVVRNAMSDFRDHGPFRPAEELKLHKSSTGIRTPDL